MRNKLLLLILIFSFPPIFLNAQIAGANFGAVGSRSGGATLSVTFRDSTFAPHLWKYRYECNLASPNLSGDTGTVSLALNNYYAGFSHNYTTSGTYTVQVIIYDSLGHIDTVTKTNYVTVTPSSVFSAAAAPPKSGYAPLPVTFNNTSSGGGLRKFLWQFDTTNPADTITKFTTAGFVHTFTASGTYSVKLTVYDSLGNVVSSTKANYDTVRPKAAFTNTPPNGCVGTSPLSVHFYDASTGHSARRWFYNYDTTNHADTSSNPLTPSPLHNYTVAATYTVKHVIYDSLGNRDSTYGTIVVAPQPTVRFSTTADTVHLCSPSTVTFTNSSDTCAGCTYNFKWYIDTAVIITTHVPQNVTYTFTKPGSYDIALVEQSSAICNCGPRSLTKHSYINVDSPSVPGFNTVDTSGCGAPYTVLFNNTTTGGVTYFWKFGDGTTDTSTSPVHVYSATNTTGYSDTLTAYTTGGCPTTYFRNNYVKVGHFNPGFQTYTSSPTISITNICMSSNLTLKDTTFGSTNHHWRFSPTPADTLNTISSAITHFWVTSGVYSVMDSSWNSTGCSGKAYHSIFVAPNPIIDSIKASRPFRCAAPDSVNFTTYARDTFSLSVMWQFGELSLGHFDSSFSDSMHVYNTPGFYSPVLRVTDAIGCNTTATYNNLIYIGNPNYSIKVTNDSGCLAVPVTYYDTVGENGISLRDSIKFYLDSANYGDGSPTDTLSSITFSHTYTSTGRFMMHNYFHLDTSLGGCSYVDSILVSRGLTPSLKNPLHAILPSPNDSFCPQANVVLSDSCYNCSSVLWNVAGKLYQKDTTINFLGATTGQKYVVYVANFNGCTDTLKNDSLYIWPPNIGFTVSIPAAGCLDTLPDSFLFTNTSNPPTGYLFKYTWNFGDGSALVSNTGTTPGALINPVHLYSAAGSYSVTLTDSSETPNNHGCINVLTIPVFVYKIVRPPSDTNFYASATLTCKNSPITFRGYYTKYDSLYKTYKWEWGDGSTSTSNVTDTFVHSYTATGTYSPRLVLTTKYGCVDSETRTNYVTIEAPNKKVLVGGSVTSASVPVISCSYFYAHFTDSATPYAGTTLARRRWLFNGTPSVAGSNVPPTTLVAGTIAQTDTTIIYPQGLYHVYITDTDNLGCFSVDTVQINSVKPHAYFTSNDTIACTHVAIHFHDTTSHVSYNWIFGDNTGVVTSSSTDTSHKYFSNGTYSDTLVTISDGTGLYPAGCRDTLVRSNYVQIGNSSVNANFNFSGISYASCPPLLVHTSNISTSTTTGHYLWYFGVDSAVSSTTTSPFFTYTYPGTYTVTLVDTIALGCKDTLRKTVDIGGPTGTLSLSPDTICAGQTCFLHLSSAVLISGVDTPYTWTVGSVGGTYTTDTAGTIVTYPTAGVYHPYVIIHQVSSGCPVTVYASDSITVRPRPAMTAARDSICKFGSVMLTATGANAYSWSPSTGLSATNVASPTASPTVTTVYKIIGTSNHGCVDSLYDTLTVRPTPTAIGGTLSICNYDSTALTNGTAGGVWSSQDTNKAVVSATGVVKGKLPGSVTISYSIGSCVATAILTVMVQPASISGSLSVCNYSYNTLMEDSTGGHWTTSNHSVATISGTGLVTAYSVGTTPVSYTIGSCSSSAVLTVNNQPSGILGANWVCNLAQVTLSDDSSGGTWSTNAPAIDSIGAFSGILTGKSAGVATITYSIGTCNATKTLTILALPDTIAGSAVVCQALTTSLSDDTLSGFWSSANTSVAIVGSTSGVVTGIGAGNVSISYTKGVCSVIRQITVNPKPTLGGLTPSSLKLCNGSSLTLTAGAVANYLSTPQYLWSGPGAFAESSDSTYVVFTPTPTVSTGIYSLSVIDSATGCTSLTSVTANINVYNLPTIAGLTSSSYLLCAGSPFTITAVSPTGSGTLSYYSWSGPNGYSATSLAASQIITPSDSTYTGIYSVAVTYVGTGCVSSTQTSSLISVNPVPILSGITASATEVCIGAPLTLSAGTVSAVESISSYNWSGPRSYSFTNTTPSAIITPSATSTSGIYSLSVSMPGTGCTSSVQTTAFVTVNALPTLSGITASTNLLCTGSTLTLTGGAVTGTGSLLSYNWSGPEAYITTTGTNTATIVASDTSASGYYSLSVTYEGTGCTSTTHSTASRVVVDTLPWVTGVTPSSALLCVGSPLTLTAGTANGSGSLTSFNWSGPNGYGHTGTASSVVFTPTVTLASGVYSLSVTYPGTGCTSIPVNTGIVTIDSLPTISGVTSSAATLCVGTDIILTAGSVTGTGGLVSYNWTGPSGYSATGITAIDTIVPSSPANGGTYSLTVTYPGTGCKSSVATTSVVVRNLPTITSVTPSSTLLCAGISLTLTGAGASGTGGLISYNWTGPNSYNQTGTTTTAVISSLTTAASGIYSLSVTYPGTGCTSATQTTAPVTVNPLPSVSSITSSTNEICTGNTLSLNAAPATGMGTLVSYNWSGPAGYSSTSLTNAVALIPGFATATGMYSVIAVYPGTGCSSPVVATPVVTVNALPTLSGISASTNLLCTGSTLTLTGGAVTGTGSLLSYNWSGPEAYITTTGTNTSTIVASDTSASGYYSLSVTYEGTGCTSTTHATASRVVVDTLPWVTGVTASTSLVCIGTSITFTSGIPNGKGVLSSYNWSGPNSYGHTGTASSVVFTPTVTLASGVYSLSVTYPGTGCTSLPVVTGYETVDSILYLSGVTASTSLMCADTILTLTAGSITGAVGPPIYNWSGPAGYSATSATGTKAVTPISASATGVYSLFVTDNTTGCSSAKRTTAIVTVNAFPFVTGAVPSSTLICEGNTLTLSAGTAIGGGSLLSYNWAGPNGFTATGLTTSVTLVPSTTAASGIYSLSVTYPGNGCTSNARTTSYITVNPVPVAPVITTSSSLLCSGAALVVSATGLPVGSGTLTSYNWSGPGGYNSVNTNPSVTINPVSVLASGIYSLSVTYPGTGCTSPEQTSGNITVNPIPTMSGVTSSLSHMCTGTSFVLHAGSATGSGTLTSYNWSGPAGFVNSTTVDSLVILPNNTSYTGVYSLSVTYPGTGCTSSMKNTGAVIVDTLPWFTSVTPSTLLLCTDVPFTLSASGTSGSSSLLSYNWSGPGGFLVVDTMHSVTVIPATTSSSGVYSLSVTYAGTGCTSLTKVSSAVTVNPAPAITSISTLDTLMCTGSVLQLTAGGASGTGALVGYIWSGPNGFAATGLASTTTLNPVAGASSGIYSVYVSYVGSGCNSDVVVTRNITVNPLPTLSDVTASTDLICVGSTLYFTAGDAWGLGTLASYNWYGPSGYSSTTLTGTNALLITDTMARGIYSLSVTYPGYGCTSTISATSQVSVNPLPVSSGISTNVSSLCTGSSFILKCLGESGRGGLISFDWVGPDGLATSTTINTLNVAAVSSAQSGLYGVSVVYPGVGCISTQDTVSVSVHRQPAPISGDSTLCNLNIVYLSDDSTGGLWTSLSTTVATINPISGVLRGIRADTVTVKYVYDNCTTSMRLHIYAQPDTITGPDYVCLGNTTTLNESMPGGVWSNVTPGVVAISVLPGSNCALSTVSDGVAILSYTIGNPAGGCSVSKELTVNPLPGAILGNFSPYCNYSEADLSDTVFGGTWSSSHPAVATIDGATGVVTCLSAGSTTIKYAFGNCAVTSPLTVTRQPGLIYPGDTAICGDSSFIMTNDSTGGVWVSGNASVATINHSGVVKGISAGTAQISYAIGSCYSFASVTINPQPSLITGANGAICNNSTITLTDSLAGGIWSIINDSDLTSQSLIGDNAISVLASRVSVSKVYYTVGYCNSYTVITVNPQPAPILVMSDSICKAGTTTLSDDSTGGVWSSSNTGVATVGATGIVTGTLVSGLNPDTVTIYYAIGTCKASAMISVNPLPMIGVRDTITCPNLPVTLTATGAGSYQWAPVAGLSCSTCPSPTIVTASVTTTYTVTGTSAKGCVSQAYLRDSVDVLVPLTFTGRDSICFGQKDSLSATGTATAFWYPHTNMSCYKCQVTLVQPDTTMYYFLVSEDSVGCSDTTSHKITVIPFAQLANDNISFSICSGAPFTFNDTLSLSTATATWQRKSVAGVIPGARSGSDGIVETLTDTNLTNNLVFYTYYLNNLGCIDTSSISVFVEPYAPAPYIAFGPRNKLCNGSMYQEFSAATPQPQYVNYEWTAMNADVYAVNRDRQSCLVNFADPGLADVILTAFVNGADCYLADTFYVQLSDSAAPNRPEIIYENNNFICLLNAAASYQWGFDDANTFKSDTLMGEINQNYYNPSPDFNTRYYWVIVSQAGCNQKSYYNEPTGVQQVGTIRRAEMNVYPNPVSETLNVEVEGNVDGVLVINDVSGQQIFNVKMNGKNTEIEVEKLPAGFYWITYYEKGVVLATTKFIKIAGLK